MAEFENGLPPQSTDLSGKNISNITFSQSDASASQNNKVGSVVYLTADFDPLSEVNIHSVQFTTERVGQNHIFFLL